MFSKKSIISQYLDNYSEIEVKILENLPFSSGPFSCGLALPLRGESVKDVERFLRSLHNPFSSEGTPLLVVAVINGSPADSNDLKDNNALVLERAQSRSFLLGKSIYLEVFSSDLTILWVDRFKDTPFSEKEGVGLARKIGCDMLLSLYAKGRIESPWLWTSDADAELPFDYFIPLASFDGIAALHYRYRHQVQDFAGAEALILYEIHLRYYCLGLQFAHSPYAFPTIGSCLAVNPLAYAAVRGFPNRQAGEDFHLLNKLRKVGKIHYLNQRNPLFLEGRFSKRVPFGTGRATLDIFDQLSRSQSFHLYHPEVFRILKTLLLETRDFLADPTLSEDQFCEAFVLKLPEVKLAFEALHLKRLLCESLSRKDIPNRIRHFATSFDALKTLRMIHFVDNQFPKLPWREALQSASFLQDLKLNPLLQQPREMLCSLQVFEESVFGLSPNNDFFSNVQN